MSVAAETSTVLVLSQVYAPDPAAVGQYMADAAQRLAATGLDVRVLTANRGYDDPSRRFTGREEEEGVQIRRLPLSSSGKASLLKRLLGQMSFVVQCAIRGIFTRNLGAVFCTTSPPFAAAAGLLIGIVRRVPVHYWLMDINPDQAVVAGQIPSTSMLARSLDWLNRQVLKRASTVIPLDRFMEERFRAKASTANTSFDIIPPWPLDTHVTPIPAADNWFRHRHGLDGKRVVMYSGNHSPVHPLTTLVEAAQRLESRSDLVFVFVGGGLEKQRIDDAISDGASNLISLPYQPLDAIATSLSAADVHVVVLGEDMRGIVHPSKVYNAMLAGRPVLYIGPRPSHVTDLLDAGAVGWSVAHGNIDATVAALERIADTEQNVLNEMGQTARELVLDRFDPGELSTRLCQFVNPG